MRRNISKLRADAEAIFRAGLAAVDAGAAVHRHLRVEENGHTLCAGPSLRLPLSKFGRVVVVGGGKAAAPMGVAVEQIFADNLPIEGALNVKYGHTSPRPKRIVLTECGHPVPDAAGVEGTRAIERLLDGVTKRDLVLILISGGASALLPAPAAGITLGDKQAVTDLLLRAGADIQEFNAVRKHLSSLKGGQLAARVHGAPVVTLLLSDVIGDRLDVIGSGPTVPDPSTFADALLVLDRYQLTHRVPLRALEHLHRGDRGESSETLKDKVPGNVHNFLIGSNGLALEAAQQAAAGLGYETSLLSRELQGESREVAIAQAARVRSILIRRVPSDPPVCLLSGGETTVTVHGPGKGGRNMEFALAALIEIRGQAGLALLAAGTDGTDGPTDAAGAIIDGTSFDRAEMLGLSPADYLHRNDSYGVLLATGDLFRTGPTGTNVMDLVIWLADGRT